MAQTEGEPMTQVQTLSPIEVQRQIRLVIESLEDGTHLYKTQLAELADAEAEYKRVMLTAYATSTSAVTSKKFEAEKAAIVEFRIWRIKEAAAKATAEYLRTLRAQLDGLRTLNTDLRGQT